MSYPSTVAPTPNGEIASGAVSQKPMFQVKRGIKNASYLALGNVVGQAISLIGFTYIARILGPNDYGIYVTVGAFVGIFDVLLLGGMNKVIIREGSQDISSLHQALEGTIAVRSVLSVLATVVCIICCFFTPYEFQTKLYIALLSLQLAYTGLKGFLATIYQATQQMQYVAIFGVARHALCVCVSIILLSCGLGLLALFVTALGSDLAAILITYKYSRSLVPFKFLSKLQFDWHLLKPALVFSLLGFMAFFVSRVDLLMISLLGSAENVGVYGVAYKIAQQGEILRNVCAVAFFPVFVKHFSREAVKSSVLTKYSLYFLGAILVLTAVASLFVEALVVMVFGSQYEAAGNILKVLIFYVGFSWASLPFTTALQATHNERYLILPVIVMGGLNVALNYVLFMEYGLIGIAYATLVVMAASCFVCGVTAVWILKRQGHLV